MSNLKKGSTIDGKVILTEPDLPVQKAGDQLLFGEHTVYTTGNKPTNEDVGSMPIAGGTFTGKVTTKEINVPMGQKATFGTKSSIEEAKDGSLIVSSNNVKVGVDASTVLTKDSIVSNSINANTELKEKGNRVYSQNNTTNDKNGFVRLFGNAETALKSDLDKVASDLANIDLTSIIVQNTGKNANVTMSQNATTIELGKKITGGSVVSQSGSSNVDVMSQKATTDAIDKVSKESFKQRGELGTLDLNTLSDANSVGVWFQDSHSSATTARHYPIAEAGSLEVLQTAGITQRYTTNGTNEVYIRNNYKYPGPFEFSEWVKQPSAKDTDKLSKDVAAAQKQADKGVSDAATAQSKADSAYNLANSKQDKLTFVGNGSEVMKTGAFGLGSLLYVPGNDLNNAMRPGFYQWLTDCSNAPVDFGSAIVTSWDGNGSESAEQFAMKNGNAWIRGKNNASSSWTSWIKLLTESDRTSSLGASTTLVATQKLVNDVSTRTTTAQARADSAYSLANTANGAAANALNVANGKTTEAWVKSQGYITAAQAPKGLRLGEVQEMFAGRQTDPEAQLNFYGKPEARMSILVGVIQRGGQTYVQYRKIIE